MTDPRPAIDADRITDEETFIATLNAVLQSASDNDIELERPFECRNGETYPYWEVTIVEVTKPAAIGSDE